MQGTMRGAQGRPVLFAAAVALLLAGASAPAHAGSATDGAGALNLNQSLNFTLVYPRFMRFRVGAAAAGSVNTLEFAPTVVNVGNATPLGGSGGDVSGSTVTVEIVGNNGQVVITPTNNSGGLGLGTGTPGDGYISYAQIATASSDPALPPPTLADGGGTASQPTPTAGLITVRSAQWTYSYQNQAFPSAGTYGAGGGTGGRVTYTASMP